MRILPIVPLFHRYHRSLQNFFAKLREAFVPVEDQWTWTTQNGMSFEGVEVDAVEAHEVAFHHRLGVSRLPIASLSKDSRLKLVRSYQFSYHLLK